jgi:hypothetical protein
MDQFLGFVGGTGRTYPWGKGDQVIIKHLILMMIDHNILRVVVRGSQESIPGACGLKSVLQDDRRIADGPDLSKSVTVELSDRGLASRQSINLRLVQELDSNDHILVCGLSVFLRDLIQDAHRERHGVAGSPSRGTLKLTGIVEAVLA